MKKVEPAEPERRQRRHRMWKRIAAGGLLAGALLLIPLAQIASGQGWNSDFMIAIYILCGLIVATELGIIILLNTARTRYSVEERIREHREVHEYVILWNRPRWLLYAPVLVASVVFGIILLLRGCGLFPQAVTPSMLGGIWVVLWLLNVLVEQYHMSIKVVFIIVPSAGAVLLLLHLVGYADNALGLLRHTAVELPSKFYFMAAFVLALVIFLGWVHGLFHYLAVTPNMADLQRGLTETGRQIKNADYDVDFDATDVVERWLFGFGRIIISFRDPNRPAIVFFVPHASSVDEKIRRVRSVTAIDRSEEEEEA